MSSEASLQTVENNEKSPVTDEQKYPKPFHIYGRFTASL